MRIVFIGPPGAGKGTQSTRVAKRLGLVHLSTGEVLRQSRDAGEPLGLAAAELLDRGHLVDDQVVVPLVAQRLAADDCNTGYLFDGFPRTLPQAQALDVLLSERGAPLDLAVEFVIPQEELLARLTKRGRSDDREQTVRERLRIYAATTRPLADYYRQRGILAPIDAVGAMDEVFDRLTRAIEDRRG